MKKLTIACAWLFVIGQMAWADGLPPRQPSRIGQPLAAPQPQVVLDAWRGSPYAGLLAGYAYSEKDEFQGGAFLGYKATNGLYEVGVEMDLSTNPSRIRERFVDRPGTRYDETLRERLENWQFSLRGIAGVYVAPKVLGYGTAGVAWIEGDTGLVWGGGLRYDIDQKWSAKAELLRYELDEPATALRIGAAYTWN